MGNRFTLFWRRSLNSEIDSDVYKADQLITYTETKAQDDRLKERLSKQESQATKVVPVLVLGYCRSGKSTFITQLSSPRLYPEVVHHSPPPAFAPSSVEVMRDTTVASLRLLSRAALASGEPLPPLESAQFIARQPPGCALTLALAEAMQEVWGRGGRAVQVAFDKCYPQLAENLMYLVGRAREQAMRDFSPSPRDLLRLYMPTTRPSRLLLRDPAAKFTVEVCEIPGGMCRNPLTLRHTCASVRDSALVVFFCVSLADYHSTVVEVAPDSRQPSPPRNLLQEALKTWATLVNSPHFEHSHLTLLLTKRDVFEESVRTVELRHEGSTSVPPRFLDYRGGKDHAAALSYIEALFYEKAKDRRIPVTIQALNLVSTKTMASVCMAFKERFLSVNEDRIVELDRLLLERGGQGEAHG